MSKKAPAPPSDPLAYFIHGQRFYACDCALMHEGFDQEVKDFTVYGAGEVMTTARGSMSRRMSASGGKADMDQLLLANLDL